MGKQGKQLETLFFGAPKSLQMVTAAMKLKDTPWKKSYDQPRQHIKKQRHYFVKKGLSSQGYGFSSGHVWMWELYYKENWVLKNWCFWTVMLEKILESPLDCKEIQPVHPKGNQSWILIGRTDAEAEAPILWPPDVKNWLIGRDPDAGKDWRQEEKGTPRPCCNTLQKSSGLGGTETEEAIPRMHMALPEKRRGVQPQSSQSPELAALVCWPSWNGKSPCLRVSTFCLIFGEG